MLSSFPTHLIARGAHPQTESIRDLAKRACSGPERRRGRGNKQGGRNKQTANSGWLPQPLLPLFPFSKEEKKEASHFILIIIALLFVHTATNRQRKRKEEEEEEVVSKQCEYNRFLIWGFLFVYGKLLLMITAVCCFRCRTVVPFPS